MTSASHRRLRRTALVTAALTLGSGALVVSAPADATSVPDDSGPSESLAPAVFLEGATTYEEIVNQYVGLGTDAQPGEFPRTIRHAAGETTLDAQPLRIVTLDSAERDALLALDILPAGITTGTNDPDAVADVPRVGDIESVNLEAIAALEPDLILSNLNRTEDLYDDLSEIAPTVMAVQSGVPWKENFALFAAALGQEETAGEVIAAYDARVAELRALRPVELPTVSLLRVRADDMRLYQRSSYSGVILDDVGLPRPEQSNFDANFVELSLEQVDQVDADLVLVAIDSNVDEAQATEFLEQPLWQTISAHDAGHVHQVNGQTWIAGGGYQGAMAILDELETILADYAA